MTEHLRAYNSLWQVRSDSWCRLEEAADRLTRPDTAGALKEQVCERLPGITDPPEHAWSPTGPILARPNSREFNGFLPPAATTSSHRRLAQINRALTTESYRTGDVDNAGADELDMFPSDPRTLEHQTGDAARPPVFRGARRREDDRRPGTGAAQRGSQMATPRRRIRLRARGGVQRRRGTHRGTAQRQPAGGGDPAALFAPIDPRSVELCRSSSIPRCRDELADHQSPEERAQILAVSLAKLRPELDLYLMTEIDVEDIAGRLGQYFRRVFHAREGMLELHLSILQGVAARYRTPFFSALKQYSHRPTGVFHALPISQGKSIVNSHWIKDMVGFYGLDVFMAETSATCGGLDSLLEPTGPLRESQQLASKAYGSRHTYFVTNGTSTANKIVTQALVAPGDIVLLDRNCHQSHHYGMMLAGANVVYLEAYPLNEYSMYGAVPLREIKSKLLALKRAGKLDRVKMMSLTNCTFDGIVYDVAACHGRVPRHQARSGVPLGRGMVRLRPFPPGLSHTHRDGVGGGAARAAAGSRTTSVASRSSWPPRPPKQPSDDDLLDRRLMPDPARARVRVYATQSTHKTLTALRQGSMIHVYDQDFDQKVAVPFHEAYMAHTSTSPNYQILASLDLGRRQVALEGAELVQRQIENAMQLRDAIDNHPLLSKYMNCLGTSDLIPDEFRPTAIDQPLRSGLRNMMAAWDRRRVRARPVANHVVHRAHRL